MLLAVLSFPQAILANPGDGKNKPGPKYALYARQCPIHDESKGLNRLLCQVVNLNQSRKLEMHMEV